MLESAAEGGSEWSLNGKSKKTKGGRVLKIYSRSVPWSQVQQLRTSFDTTVPAADIFEREIFHEYGDVAEHRSDKDASGDFETAASEHKSVLIAELRTEDDPDSYSFFYCGFPPEREITLIH